MRCILPVILVSSLAIVFSVQIATANHTKSQPSASSSTDPSSTQSVQKSSIIQRLSQGFKNLCCSTGTNEDEDEMMVDSSTILYEMQGSYRSDENKVISMEAYFNNLSDEIRNTNINSSNGKMHYRLECVPGTIKGSATLNIKVQINKPENAFSCTASVIRNNNILTVQQPFSCTNNLSAFICLDDKCGTYQPPSEDIDMDLHKVRPIEMNLHWNQKQKL